MPIAVRIFCSTGVLMAFCRWTFKLKFYSELQLIWISSILDSFAICHAFRAWSLKRIRTLHSTSVVLGWQLQVSLSRSFLLFTSGAPFKNIFCFHTEIFCFKWKQRVFFMQRNKVPSCSKATLVVFISPPDQTAN